jgi:hypothetical protein
MALEEPMRESELIHMSSINALNMAKAYALAGMRKPESCTRHRNIGEDIA